MDAQSVPLLVGAEPVLPVTPTEGVGSRPTFEWEAVDGAASYFLVVKDDAGAAYWAWDGSETSIPLGGADFPMISATVPPSSETIARPCELSALARVYPRYRA